MTSESERKSTSSTTDSLLNHPWVCDKQSNHKGFKVNKHIRFSDFISDKLP